MSARSEMSAPQVPEDKSPRVLHLVPAIFGGDGTVGGAERYAFELARHMAELVPTTLLSFGDRDRVETIGPLRVRVLGHPWYVRGQRFNPVAWPMFAEMRRAADVIHCHQQHILASSLAALAGRLGGRRVFVSDLGGGGWDISAWISTDRWFDGHLHISDYSRAIAGHRGKPWAHVIMGGVDTGKFSPAVEPASDGPVLFVGRLLPHKGINYLIEAIDESTPLTLIGRRWRHAQGFYDLLQELAASRRVVFREDCDDAAIIAAYRRALCVVLPSVYTTVFGDHYAIPELLGQTLLEGMACGTPAVCTAVGGMPEVVDDGVTGFVVPPNDPAALAAKIRWLREHPAEARQMGQAARQRVLDRFSWDRVVDRCLEAYGIS